MSDSLQCDKTLVQRASQDSTTPQTLYESYFHRVYRYVMTRVDHPQNAEDLASEIFIQMIKGLPKFRNQYVPSFAAWIFAIARNAIADFYRRKGRTPHQLALDDLVDHSLSSFDPYILLIERENRSELHMLLQLLPERRREVVILKYFADLRNLEIAEVMGIDERTVASHLNRGLKDLYEAYMKKFEAKPMD